jgi:hypothetical protein
MSKRALEASSSCSDTSWTCTDGSSDQRRVKVGPWERGVVGELTTILTRDRAPERRARERSRWN